MEAEPECSGKVIIHTTYGPLETELWCHQVPLFTRSFLQLCLEGYYDLLPFHRLVSGFILQGGDPTGTGQGGLPAPSSADYSLIPSEYHTRLKWTRRGLLGVAAMNDRGDGGSQFFLTLSETPELYRKATLFGKVVGETIYNLVRMGELDVEPGSERPLNAPIILRTQVLLNPFDDIIPRELEEVRLRRLKANLDRKPESKDRRPAISLGTSKKTLSFDYDDDETGEETLTSRTFKAKSSHDLLLNDPTLCRQAISLQGAAAAVTIRPPSEPMEEPMDLASFKAQMAEKQSEQVCQIKSQIEKVQLELKQMSSLPPSQLTDPQLLPHSATKADSLAQLLGVKRPASKGMTSQILEDQRNAYKTRSKVLMGRRGRSAADEMDTLLALNTFRDKLKTTDSERVDPCRLPAVAPKKQLDICKLHGLVGCESCRDTFGGSRGGEESEEGWLMHRLVFDKDAGYREMRADLDQLKVIDPRDRLEDFVNKKK